MCVYTIIDRAKSRYLYTRGASKYQSAEADRVSAPGFDRMKIRFTSVPLGATGFGTHSCSAVLPLSSDNFSAIWTLSLDNFSATFSAFFFCGSVSVCAAGSTC